MVTLALGIVSAEIRSSNGSVITAQNGLFYNDCIFLRATTISNI